MGETASISNKFNLYTLTIEFHYRINLKKYISILCFILYCLNSFGQGQIFFEKSVDKEIQLKHLDSLIQNTSETDINRFISYNEQYIKLAKELNQNRSAAKRAIQLLPFLEKNRTNSARAILILNRVLEGSEKAQDSLITGTLYLHRGKIHMKSNLTQAIEDFNLALDYFSIKDTLPRAEAYLLRGNTQSRKEKYILAYDDFNTAYRLFQSLGKSSFMIEAQQGITNMFSANGFYEKAIEERKRLIQITTAFDLHSYLAEEYFSQSLDFQKLGEFEEAYDNLLLAEQMSNQYETNISTLIGIHSRFVWHYSREQQLDEAKKHLNLLESLTYKDDLLSAISHLSARIQYLIVINEFDKALELAENRLFKAERFGNQEKIMEANEDLARIYYALKEYQKSIDYTITAGKIKDSIFNNSKMNALAYFQTLYETERKERELIEQATSLSLLQKDNESFKRAMLLGGIATILGFTLILLYRNHLSMQNRKRLHEQYSQKLLLSQEYERKRISENLHDGVGQQLLVIKNKLVSSGDEVAKKLLDDVVEEIRYISRDLHPFLLKEFGITKAITYTLKRIDENTKLFISSEIDNIDNLTTKENELNIYRIVQEAFSNILRHAAADAAKIVIKKNRNSILMIIRDNGIGFDFNKKYEESKSLGLKTLMERARSLNGNMKVNSKKDKGTTLEFEIFI